MDRCNGGMGRWKEGVAVGWGDGRRVWQWDEEVEGVV